MIGFNLSRVLNCWFKFWFFLVLIRVWIVWFNWFFDGFLKRFGFILMLFLDRFFLVVRWIIWVRVFIWFFKFVLFLWVFKMWVVFMMVVGLVMWVLVMVLIMLWCKCFKLKSCLSWLMKKLVMVFVFLV